MWLLAVVYKYCGSRKDLAGIWCVVLSAVPTREKKGGWATTGYESG